MPKQPIRVELSSTKKPKPQSDQLEFGKIFTDHMFVMDYSIDQGWYDPRIIPYHTSFQWTQLRWSTIMGNLFLKA